MKICNVCGFDNDGNSRFCTECGAPLPLETEETAAAEEIEETVAEAQDVVEAEEYASEPETAEAAATDMIAAPVVAAGYDNTGDQTDEQTGEQTDDRAAGQDADADTAQPADQPKNGEHTVKGRTFGIIAFILNLDALLCCLIPFANIEGLIFSIIGLIFCRISKNNTNFRLVNVAKIFGILALIFSIVTIVLYTVLICLAFAAIASDPQVRSFINGFY